MTVLRKSLDLLVGAPLRHAAYLATKATLQRKYVFELDIEPRIYALKQGAVVAAKHAHRDDGPMLIALSWPWARLRPLVYHKEYRHWLQWPFMVTVGAVPGGDGTTHRGLKPGEIVSGLLGHGWGVLVFPGGRIIHDGVTSVPPRAATVFNALRDGPDKPLVMVRTFGLGRDEPQTRDPVTGKPLVRIVARVFRPDLACGLEVFNARMADHLNTGAPIPEISQPTLQPSTS
jgi:1-acyl-sn-glycerol-3-phosphate acyltransferase